jgi:hypothetical protein
VSGILVPYFSGSYGCDSSVPIDRIDADHVSMVRTSDRTGPGNDAYLVLLRNYRENPYSEWRVAPDPNRNMERVAFGLSARDGHCSQTYAGEHVQNLCDLGAPGPHR